MNTPILNSAEPDSLPRAGCVERLVRFFLPHDHPDEGERVIVHVPRLDRRERGDGDGIYMGRFIHKNINEWRIEGSNSEWEIDWWCRIPEPNV